MLKIIDRYILQKFFVTFFFCVLLFNIISVAIDTSEKTDDFVKANLSTKQIINDYYLGFIPHITGLLFPLFVFIAVIFFTSRMAARSEVIAMLSSGITFRRFLQPYFIGGLVLTIILWLGVAYVIPPANEKRANFEAKYVQKVLTNELQNFLSYDMKLDPVTYAGFRNYDTAFKSGISFFIDKLKGDQVVYSLRARSMRWDTAARKWYLEGVVIKHIDGLKESAYTRPDTLMNLGFLPGELRKDEYLKDKLTTPELNRFIRAEEVRASERVKELLIEKYRRDARAVSVLILTLIGAIISSRKVRGGSGVHLAVGIVMAALYIMFDRFSFAFSVKGNLHPLISAWIPNLLFSGVAVWLYRKAPK